MARHQEQQEVDEGTEIADMSEERPAEVSRATVAKISGVLGNDPAYTVEFPQEAVEAMVSADSELEMRILRDEHGKIVSIILNRISE